MWKKIWQGRFTRLRLVMLLAVGGLVALGLLCLREQREPTDFFARQIWWLVLAAGCFIAVNTVHYKLLGQISFVLYSLCLLLLVFILVGKYVLPMPGMVPMRNWAYRWIRVGPLQVQPSEAARLCYILALSWYLHTGKRFRGWQGLAMAVLMTVVPMALILRQPDLGSTLLFVPLFFALLFVAGLPGRYLFMMTMTILIAMPILYLFMSPYQKERIAGLLEQGREDMQWVRGPGYHLYQSKMYIGTGQWTGADAEQDKMVRRRHLPEGHNDFIFALIAHKWGFLGASAVLLAYVLILLGGMEIAWAQVEPFGQLLAVGLSVMIASQMLINVAMTIGLMPVTGLNLPFVSYGGTNLLCNSVALGLLINIGRRRDHRIGRKSFEFDR